MIKNFYIYVSASFDPYLNLAKEKLLFDRCSPEDMILYLWQNEKTVVIGKNQNPLAECDLLAMKNDGIRLARRLSGGGAVYHDPGNLNFTFISADEPDACERNMDIICRCCEMSGISAVRSGRNDITVEGKKFSGNAFYHSEGKFCHHGTILIKSDFGALEKYLTPSPLKLSAKGVRSVRSRVINLSSLSPELTPEKMAELIIKSTELTLGIKPNKITRLDREKIEISAAEYSSEEYLYGKTAPYSLEFAERFAWGEANVRLKIEGGKIAHAGLYTDAMDESLSAKFEKLLCGARFEKTLVKEALLKAIDPPLAEDLSEMMFREIQ